MTVQPQSPHPWHAAYPDAAAWNAPLDIVTLPELLERARRRFGDRPLIEFRDRTIGFEDFAARVDALAAGLLRIGIGPGTPIAHLLPNTPWFPICFFAAARIGARIVHISPLDAPREIVFKLADSGARTLVTTNIGGMAERAGALVAGGHVDRLLVGDDAIWGPSPATDAVAWSDTVLPLPTAAPPVAWPEVDRDDIAVLQYTGGTTGLPKGAMLSHANLTAADAIYRNWRTDRVVSDDVADQDRVVCVLPMFHIFALTVTLLRSVSEGALMLLRPRFDVDTLLEDIGRKKATAFAGVPTMWIALANHPKAGECDFSSLRDCVTGGAAIPFEIEQRVTRLVGQRLLNGWGMTETSPAGTRVVPGSPAQPNLIGIPLPGIDIRIVSLDDPDQALGFHETGEIAIRGPNVFKGYWNRPEETAKSFADGWFLTGDIGQMDESGQVFLLDRKKNMIISSGFNVYPASIEQAIYEHEDVAEAIVIGIPDEYRGQAAKAFIALKPGAEPITLEDLRAFLAERVGRHEMPAALELRDQLPRSPVGKLLAKVLIDEETAKRQQAPAEPAPNLQATL
jgi:long-chain acyl-CoA synthetase